jgi:hypothetical protein
MAAMGGSGVANIELEHERPNQANVNVNTN